MRKARCHTKVLVLHKTIVSNWAQISCKTFYGIPIRRNCLKQAGFHIPIKQIRNLEYLNEQDKTSVENPVGTESNKTKALLFISKPLFFHYRNTLEAGNSAV